MKKFNFIINEYVDEKVVYVSKAEDYHPELGSGHFISCGELYDPQGLIYEHLNEFSNEDLVRLYESPCDDTLCDIWHALRKRNELIQDVKFIINSNDDKSMMVHDLLLAGFSIEAPRY